MHPVYSIVPFAAAPTRKTFDLWNSSSTGHQRAENRLSSSTSWRQSRTSKLGNQFASGAGGGKRMFDNVGAGSKDFGRDGRKENGSWGKEAKRLRGEGWRDVGITVSKESQTERKIQKQEKKEHLDEYYEMRLGVAEENGDGVTEPRHQRGLFQNLSFYINGSTAPTVSDHKLKQILAENGGRISLGLARRRFTHVIVGRPIGKAGGAGGGLSGSKIEKEIQRVRGCGVKFVNVEWVFESLKAGKRQPEHAFEGVKTAPRGVGSVAKMFQKQGQEKDKLASLKKGPALQKDDPTGHEVSMLPNDPR